MRIEEFELPSKEKVTLIFVEDHQGFGAKYINAVRLKSVAEDSAFAQQFNGMIKLRSLQLMASAKDTIGDYDAVVSPPSSRSDAMSIRDAALRGVTARDLSTRFGRYGSVKAHHPGVTEQDMFKEFTYERANDESEVKSLLIVDDSIESGKSVAAVLKHLKDAGMSNHCRVTVLVWVNMRKYEEGDAPKTEELG